MPDTASARGNVLGFDYGLKRIGVAVGQAETLTASGLETVANGEEPEWGKIDRLIGEWRPVLLLVGLPLGPEGEDTEMSRAARAFGKRLSERFDLPVRYADERLSSREARSRFANLRSVGGTRRKHARRMDAMAAQIILENWLQSYGRGDRAV